MTFVNVLDVADDELVHPDIVGDWTVVFGKAIKKVVDEHHAGVLVPAREAPYAFPDPGTPNMSIDLRGVHDFVLMGEGPRSVLAMTGNGEWRLIHIGDGASDVVVRDLCLDGSEAKQPEPPQPPNDQSHLVVIGASRANSVHGARRVSVLDCTLRQALSDGVAIAPASSTDPQDEVSDITISGCHFLGNRRSGVSNQRLAKRVSILHNRFEGTTDGDIDFEPSGGLPDAGPSGYLILGNTMVRESPSVSVTLSGITPESRSRVNTFAYNQILGGQLGVHWAQDLAVVGNYIEIGPGVKGTVVRLSGAIERLLFADNSVVRPENAEMGTLMNLSSEPKDIALLGGDPHVIDVATDTFTHTGHLLQTGTGPMRASVATGGTLPGGLSVGVDYWAIKVDPDLFQLALSPQDAEAQHAVDISSLGSNTFHLLRHGFPRTVSISRNRFSTSRPPEGEPLITLGNASTVSFRDNDVASYAGVEIPVALKFESRDAVHKRQVTGWDVVGNRFRGNGRLPPRFEDPPTGSFDTCVSMSAGHDSVGNVRVAENTFSGCRIQVLLHAEKKSDDGLLPAGAFVRAPHVTGNIGDGTFVDFKGVSAVLVGGNLAHGEPGGARFCGPDEPKFSAPVGSLYSRTGGGADPRLWINTDGATQWKALALAP
jgi:hypothetical protein